jgi:hypothetical protein
MLELRRGSVCFESERAPSRPFIECSILFDIRVFFSSKFGLVGQLMSGGEVANDVACASDGIGPPASHVVLWQFEGAVFDWRTLPFCLDGCAALRVGALSPSSPLLFSPCSTKHASQNVSRCPLRVSYRRAALSRFPFVATIDSSYAATSDIRRIVVVVQKLHEVGESCRSRGERASG